MEGLVADRNLTLGHLIGTIKTFFEKIGITQLRFKPAFNPYTEPSMEIFGYHPELKKWTEIGNSGECGWMEGRDWGFWLHVYLCMYECMYVHTVQIRKEGRLYAIIYVCFCMDITYAYKILSVCMHVCMYVCM